MLRPIWRSQHPDKPVLRPKPMTMTMTSEQGLHKVSTWPYGHGWGGRDPNKKESVKACRGRVCDQFLLNDRRLSRKQRQRMADISQLCYFFTTKTFKNRSGVYKKTLNTMFDQFTGRLSPSCVMWCCPQRHNTMTMLTLNTRT